MPNVHVNGIDLEYEELGDPEGRPLLLIMGLGAQMIAWDDDLCRRFGERGFRVIRFDNRDVGLSTKLDHQRVDFVAAYTAYLAGEPVQAPYSLEDMADDAAGLLDAVGIPAAHVVGASLGGMIAQALAIRHPDKVLSLTSIMSTTGDPDVGQPTGEALTILLQPAARTREEAIERDVETTRAIGSPDHFDEDRVRRRATAAYDRCFYPAGIVRQLAAIASSGTRADGLRRLRIPAVVIHGSVDPLVQPSGGARTAELIPGAELIVLEGMGHDLPQHFWGDIIDAVEKIAAHA